MREQVDTSGDPGGEDDAQVAHLDQAIWRRLRSGVPRAQFLDAWLTLQCRTIGNVVCAALVLPDRDQNRFVPAALWPADTTVDAELASATELAMAERRGVLRPLADGAGDAHVALPFVVDGRLVGALALRVRGRSARQMRLVMRQLQWGAGWIELFMRREAQGDAEQARERSSAALDIVVTMLDAHDFRAASTAVATATASRLDCDRVAIGMLKGRHCRVVALSHSSDVGHRMHLIADIGKAMDEALDQGAALVRTADRGDDDQPWVTRAQAALIRSHGAMAVMTVPLVSGDTVVGAITLEHRDADGFEGSRASLAQAIASVIGPILEDKQANDRTLAGKVAATAASQLSRLLGPSHLGRKVTLVLLLALVAFFWVAREDYEVAANATLEGRIQRVVAAPFDGYLVEQAVRPGDLVETGQVLARFDDRDIQLERLAAIAEMQQRQIEQAAALAAGERTQVRVLEAQIAQTAAHIQLLDEQLGRTAVVAPFAGVIVSGDHSQDIGSAIERGEELFVVAPLDGFRVALLVDERNISDVMPGQTGAVRFASMPDTPIPFEVERVMPVAEARDGVNRFRVEGSIDPAQRDADGRPLLPGMEGVGRVDIGERRLIWIWTHTAFEWLRLAIWRWLP